MSRIRGLVILLAVLLIFLANAAFTCGNPVYYPVTSVVDGDTFKCRIGKKVETVRLIGVDTPETVHPNKIVEPYGKEASAFTKKLLKGKSVRLEYDTQKRDKYGRLLAYVYLPNGTFVNAVLVQRGYAQVLTVPPNVRYAKKFVTLQQKARQAELGLWNKRDKSTIQPTVSTALNGRYIGNLKSNIFHSLSCKGLPAKNNQIYFKNRTEAVAKGYKPCGYCRP